MENSSSKAPLPTARPFRTMKEISATWGKTAQVSTNFSQNPKSLLSLAAEDLLPNLFHHQIFI